jgi:hypothetical protein
MFIVAVISYIIICLENPINQMLTDQYGKLEVPDFDGANGLIYINSYSDLFTKGSQIITCPILVSGFLLEKLYHVLYKRNGVREHDNDEKL